MTIALPFRRLLTCWVALCVAATGLVPQCEAAPVPSDVQRPCCCGGPGACRCGDACTCLSPLRQPARADGAEKAEPRPVPQAEVRTVRTVARLAFVAGAGVRRSETTLTLFPSLRILEVRIQT